MFSRDLSSPLFFSCPPAICSARLRLRLLQTALSWPRQCPDHGLAVAYAGAKEAQRPAPVCPERGPCGLEPGTDARDRDFGYDLGLPARVGARKRFGGWGMSGSERSSASVARRSPESALPNPLLRSIHSNSPPPRVIAPPPWPPLPGCAPVSRGLPQWEPEQCLWAAVRIAPPLSMHCARHSFSLLRHLLCARSLRSTPPRAAFGQGFLRKLSSPTDTHSTSTRHWPRRISAHL